MYGKKRAVRKGEILSQIEINVRKCGEGLTMYEIAQKVDLARNRCWVLVKEMLEAGMVERHAVEHRPDMDKFVYTVNRRWVETGKGDVYEEYLKLVGGTKQLTLLDHGFVMRSRGKIVYHSQQVDASGENYLISPPYHTS